MFKETLPVPRTLEKAQNIYNSIQAQILGDGYIKIEIKDNKENDK